jgi:hypothetical protein
MTKVYIRYCDFCKQEIKNLYNYGVTTLYKQIRIGRGCSFHDYQDDSILNKVSEKKPDDYDSYGNGWKEDKSNEFSFCCPECLINFLNKLYQDTYNNSLEKIKREKKETLDISFEEFKKKHGAVIPFFKKIQTSFSKKHFEESAIEEADELISKIKEIKKKIEGKK